MSDDPRSCPSCGAQAPDDADRCDLCGADLGEGDPASESEASTDPVVSSEVETEEGASEGDPSAPSSEEASPVFCNQCGWENPPGAQYCSQCGAELQDLSASTGPSGVRPVAADLPSGETDSTAETTPQAEPSTSSAADGEETIGRQLLLLVGGALVLVVGLFFATQWSAQYEWTEESTSASAPAQAGGSGASGAAGQGPMQSGASGGASEELPDLQTLLDQTGSSAAGAMSSQIDSLEARIEETSGSQKRAAQAELVNLLVGAGQPGRAAVVQTKIAETTGTIDAQRRAADLLYRWMQKLQGEGQRKQVLQVARHAAQAYASVAEQRPDDLDARTRMGEAYLLTNRPMRGIKAINGVLDEDSTFVPARFQKGLALLQINRLDQAAAEFERVQEFAEDGSPFSRQAEQALKVIAKQRQRSGADASGPAATN